MSRFFGRIGTKAIKYSFETLIKVVSIALDTPCNVIVQWKRGIQFFSSMFKGNHTISTSRKAILDTNTGLASFDEALLLEATIYFESKINKY